MTHSANMMAGVRQSCVISVTNLRIEGSLAIFLEVAQSSTLPTRIGPCMTISNIDLAYTAVKTVIVAGHTSEDLQHLRASS